MNKSLFQITEEYYGVMNALQESEGELTPEIEAALALNEEEADKKLSQMNFVLKALEADVKLIDLELERIDRLKDEKKRAIDRLKAYMLQGLLLFGAENKNGVRNMELRGGGTIVKLGTRKSTSVLIEDEDLIPEQYWNKPLPPSPTVNKVLIKEALEKGVEVPGASLNVKLNLSIK